MDALVCVVVPFYNTAKYISKCLDSIIRQSFRRYKIILVNDGSTDESVRIAEEYIKRYPDKIVLYNKENGGISSARNYALDRIECKYVTFLDGDDYIDEAYLEKLVTLAEDNNADMVCSGQYKITEDETILNTISYHPKDGNCLERRLNISGKIYSLAHLNKWKIRFPLGKTYEDNSFNLQSMFLTDKCFFLDYEGYYQVVHEGSITSKPIEAEKLPLEEWDLCTKKVLKNSEFCPDIELFEFTVLSFFTYFLFVRNRKREYLDNINKSKNKMSIIRIAENLENIVNRNFPNAVKNKYASVFRYKELQFKQRCGVKVFALLCRFGCLKYIARIL